MLKDLIYIFATISLLIGSALSFKKNLPDYFFLIGSSLFVINSLLNYIQKKKEVDIYKTLL